MNMPENVTELLQSIKNKPGAYLGEKSILRLKHFMDGYCLATEYAGIDFDLDTYYAFAEWLRTKYQVMSVVSYDTILTDRFSDDAAAFDAFFDEFELFLHEWEQ
ncbi:hypothetical protein [Ruminococcus sp. NK3A76]|uniref:hypothetical protein n=1 Tax=Ruminococcus sp. NK3A76 TaxID=877411 RepID=UPI000689E5ED|nr:hypothetical protein [Ruminococcus sp. NK3A76]